MAPPRRTSGPLLLAAALWAGCAVGGGPAELELEPLGPVVAFVGSELRVELRATDPEGDPLQWRFESTVPDLCRGGRCRAGIEPLGDGALFRWVPAPADVGSHRLRIHVTDGRTVASAETALEVRSSIGYEGLPRFVQPLGTGTTLDLSRASCVELDVVVDDPDSPSVAIGEQPPGIEGASLSAHDGFTATWRWCPTPAQLRGPGHRRLILTADDGAHPPTEKSFLVVLRRPAKPGCEGEPPTVSHAPASWRSAGDVRISARVRDDGGIKHAPLLYWTTTRPGDEPDLGRMTQVAMERVGGDAQDGTWEARVPNPTTRLPAGGSATLYYVIAASNGGDGGSDCEVFAQAPERGAYQLEVTRPADGSPAGSAACEPCSADRGCGGAEDRCVRMGTRGDAFCLDACGSDADCGEGFRCDATPVTSVDGATRRLCVPLAGGCRPEGDTACADDAHEQNDGLAAAAGLAPLAQGAHGSLVSCHLGDRDDEDWYPIVLTTSSQVIATVSGGDVTDLDLALTDAAGATLAVGESLRSSEEVTACLPAGRYYLRVYSFGEGRNEYGLSWGARAAACETEAACRPDRHEPDDDAARARVVRPTPEWSSTGNTICGGSDDWYRVDLVRGQTLIVDLAFIQTRSDEDLDLHFLDARGTDLTPCTEADPSTCSAFQGQSVDSNEHYEHTVAVGGTHYVVVRGFAGAENSYDIRMRIE